MIGLLGMMNERARCLKLLQKNGEPARKHVVSEKKNTNMFVIKMQSSIMF
jgi:hypothetical protein